jgi:ABC-type sugar transport system ATPase subunit
LFPGVKALYDVTFGVKKSYVHAIMGENGAGKSTLINILSGLYQPNTGSISIDGREMKFRSPKDSQKAGITTIFQELNVIPDLDVKSNIFIGYETTRFRFFIDKHMMKQKASEILSILALDIDPDKYVRELSVAQCKMLEIGKAFFQKSNILIMDEPTASISDKEVEKLLGFISALKNQGVTIIYISHKIEEIYKICDSITILRDGHHILTDEIKNVTQEQVIVAMINKKFFSANYPLRQNHSKNEIMLEVKNLSLAEKVKNISFVVKKGEIFGIAGIIGSGRTELVKTIIGELKSTGGIVRLKGKIIGKSPWNSAKSGMVYLSEDRKREGLFLDQSVSFNIVIASLKKIVDRFNLISNQKREALCQKMIKKLYIVTQNSLQKVGTLSGGNQQKVVIGKCLAADMDLIIFDEPTIGIDVGAKYEIRKLINEIADKGSSVIIISSEFDEVCNLSDRMIVIRNGSIAKTYDIKSDILKEEAFEYAMGSKKD